MVGEDTLSGHDLAQASSAGPSLAHAKPDRPFTLPL